MALKFIKYMMVDGEQIALDITQLITPGETRCFAIDVNKDNGFKFLLCKNKNGEWQVVSNAIPEFIILKLFENVTSAIDERLGEEKNYLTLN